MIGTLRNVALDAPDIVRLAGFYQDLAGWTQLDARDSAGRYCLTGALSKAAGEDRAAYAAALQSIGTRLNEPACAFGGFGCHCSVIRWNDRDGRTQKQVVAKLDEVIDTVLGADC